jgi:MoxR-like ATPase
VLTHPGREGATNIAPATEDLLALRHLVRRIRATKPLVRAAVTLVRMTRPDDPGAPDFVREYISWGAGPRARRPSPRRQGAGGAGRAAEHDYEDLKRVAPLVLTHRLVINFAAEAAGKTAPDLVADLVSRQAWRSS